MSEVDARTRLARSAEIPQSSRTRRSRRVARSRRRRPKRSPRQPGCCPRRARRLARRRAGPAPSTRAARGPPPPGCTAPPPASEGCRARGRPVYRISLFVLFVSFAFALCVVWSVSPWPLGGPWRRPRQGAGPRRRGARRGRRARDHELPGDLRRAPPHVSATGARAAGFSLEEQHRLAMEAQLARLPSRWPILS